MLCRIPQSQSVAILSAIPKINSGYLYKSQAHSMQSLQIIIIMMIIYLCISMQKAIPWLINKQMTMEISTMIWQSLKQIECKHSDKELYTRSVFFSFFSSLHLLCQQSKTCLMFYYIMILTKESSIKERKKNKIRTVSVHPLSFIYLFPAWIGQSIASKLQ